MKPSTVFSAAIRCTFTAAAVALLILTVVASPPSQAQTYTVLHAFTNAPDGALPNAIIRDAQGTLFGTTEGGGTVCAYPYTCGTVYKVDSAGNETVLYRFAGGNDGADPVAGLVQDRAGNLYGTTQGNGAISAYSTAFKIDPKGHETVLHVFNPSFQVCCQDSPLALDEQGNLYGMSPYGGTPNCGWSYYYWQGCGTLFKLTPGGKLTVLHTFKGTDGMQPEGGLVRDAQGNLYGSANFGGKRSCKNPGYEVWWPVGCGTIYKLDTHGKFSVLYTFTRKADGAFPLGLTIDSAGNLYGVTEWGGDNKPYYNHLYGYGTVFKLDATGKFSVLFTFTPKTTLNNVYASHLVRDSKGNLYGLQQANNCTKGGGCLFRIDPQGNYADLYDFEGENESDDGSQPMGVVFGSADDFYGSMAIGGGQPENECGEYGCGTVFHLTF
jgi:uncharacterized repeat protein (TIGR03803 family)